ncbi:MAG: ATP-binding protein [Thermodesulfobacteriota bacterium]
MDHPILFVDDNPVILKTIEVAFAREPYRLLTAADGETALALVQSEHPHVIVSDLRMEGMDGLALLQKARQIDPHFVGMIFTAYMDLDCIMQAVSEDAVWRYIAKPWQDSRELVVAVHNATELYEARMARHHAEEQLARAERLAALGHLVTGIAHQFNNINVGIMGYTQMALASPELAPDLRDHLNHIQLFARRASQIVKELSAFSDQSQMWGFARTDLTHLIEEVLALCEKPLTDDGVRFARLLRPTPPVEVNVGLVKQLVANFITNAAHATLGKPERAVRIETGAEGERVFVRVSDNGCGIPKKYLTRIFDPFYTTKGAQAPTGSPQAALPGVGLGLSLCQTIAQNHNGEITVTSEVGSGSSFTFWLPAALDQDEAAGGGAR